jgi:hypothetical protein
MRPRPQQTRDVGKSWAPRDGAQVSQFAHASDSIFVGFAEVLYLGGELPRLDQIGHGVIRPLTVENW